MITRRAFLAASGAAPASGLLRTAPAMAALPVPASGEIRFRMMRHGRQIGSHTVLFDRQGDVLTVHIVVDAAVSLGPITLYHYRHHNTEVWDGARISSLASHTDRSGTLLQMQAQRQAAGLLVNGSGTSPYVAPEAAMPTTYWNKRMLAVPMIGSQDGELVYPRVTALGPDPLPLASGTPVVATRFAVRGKVDCDLWYDASNAWAAMQFTVADGSQITYVRE